MAVSDIVERALGTGLVQPDPTTCGSCSLVVARMINDPAYAAVLVEGSDPGTGEQPAATLAERFRDHALAAHRTTNAARVRSGGWQLPWPRSLGTQPWALAQEMDRRAGRPGTRYGVTAVRPSARARAFAQLASLTAGGESVPLYVGNRWSPRHVVLVLPGDDGPRDRVRIYDPANGRCYPVTADDFVAGRLDVAGWTLPWCLIVPE